MQNQVINYNPDVLSCLANLSNDEVFTPPELANQMLDLLPQELFSSPETTFLDPATKSGVFLREIAKRLLKGLEPHIPDLQQRIDHIFTKQLFGIGITELTTLLARRSLYCSHNANGQYSIASQFENAQGNVYFPALKHKWQDKKCIHCGASQDVYDRGDNLESHAYAFIHQEVNQIIGKEMKFNVIIGNPPYQLSDGGAQASAKPIYHLFIEQAKKLNPDHLIMIVPARWYAGGKGLDEFRDTMLNDRHIKELHDFPNSSDCFSGVKIEGGVCYFLWEKQYQGDCKISTYGKDPTVSEMIRPLKEKGLTTFIRYNPAINIFYKVSSLQENSFYSLVSSRKPFGLPTNFRGNKEPYQDTFNNIKIYQNKGFGYIHKNDIKINQQWISTYKVYISKTYGAGETYPQQILNRPFLGEPNTCCTDTYLHIGSFNSREETENVISYINTRFFRFMVLLIKNTQDAPKKVYQLVPLQDFSQSWTDEKLYKKYNLSQEDINYIESMVRPME